MTASQILAMAAGFLAWEVSARTCRENPATSERTRAAALTVQLVSSARRDLAYRYANRLEQS
jgi:divalent metal cation (Fe/Co/Zn/Cd) transporter